MKRKISKADDRSGNCDCTISYPEDETVFDENDEEIDLSQIDNLFRGSGIRMMAADELFSVCHKDGKIVAALVYHQDGWWGDDEPIPIYYFSRVVSPDCQRRGLQKNF